jgi:hypothetical protein
MEILVLECPSGPSRINYIQSILNPEESLFTCLYGTNSNARNVDPKKNSSVMYFINAQLGIGNRTSTLPC